MARQAGYEGAMYPWQSGSNGQEETQLLHLNPRDGTWGADASRLQRHVNAAIAYNVWQYHVVTGDREFLSHYGAEMILEIGRFFASLARFDEGAAACAAASGAFWGACWARPRSWASPW